VKESIYHYNNNLCGSSLLKILNLYTCLKHLIYKLLVTVSYNFLLKPAGELIWKHLLILLDRSHLIFPLEKSIWNRSWSRSFWSVWIFLILILGPTLFLYILQWGCFTRSLWPPKGDQSLTSFPGFSNNCSLLLPGLSHPGLLLHLVPISVDSWFHILVWLCLLVVWHSFPSTVVPGSHDLGWAWVAGVHWLHLLSWLKYPCSCTLSRLFQGFSLVFVMWCQPSILSL
jgi:hypothetical protein